MQAALTPLIGELRHAGIDVSVGEHIDAARALAGIPLADTEAVRSALQATMVKRAEQLDAFNLLFDLFFSGTAIPESRPFAALADADLDAALRAAIASGDAAVQRLLADEYVRRFAALQPGAPVAGVFATIAVNDAANLDAIRAGLLPGAGQLEQGAGGAGGGGDGAGGGGGSGGGWRSASGVRSRLEQAAADRAVDGFRAELQAAVRRALVADRGSAAVARTMRVRLAQDVPIAAASAAELAAMAASIGPLAQRLSKILARQHRRRRLSLRRTLHLAMGTGGVPFRIGTWPAPPPKPEIVVLADMSGSVASFSRFTLDLLIALDSRLSRLRAFSFVDGLAEITELVGQARSAGRQLSHAEAAQGAVGWSGSSDYGRVLREFGASYGRQFSRRTVLLVVGDARTNYLDPAVTALAELSERVGKLYWLNPEARRYWNSGDSVMAAYAPFCAQVRECSTLRQIADFVQSLTTGPGWSPNDVHADRR
jgi:uncharacterized protein